MLLHQKSVLNNLVKFSSQGFRSFSQGINGVGSNINVSNININVGTTNPSSPIKREKHKTPFRRASKLLNELKKEEFLALKNGREWPQFLPGDVIEVTELPFASSKTPHTFKGLVTSIRKNQSDTLVRTVRAEFGSTIIRIFPMYSPLIVDIKVKAKAWIHGGKKRVRRSKLYYYEEKDPLELILDDV